MKRERDSRLLQLARRLRFLHALAQRTDGLLFAAASPTAAPTTTTGARLRKGERVEYRDVLGLQSVDQLMCLLASHDHRLEVELLGEIERSLDLALSIHREIDRHLPFESRLERCRRRIVFRARHSARIRRVHRLNLSVALRVEQLLTKRGEHAEQRSGIAAA